MRHVVLAMALMLLPVPPAIAAATPCADLAAVPGDEAAREAVARYLVSDSAPHNQEFFAIEKMGARALPALLDAARCDGPCDPDRVDRLVGLFSGMGDALAGALPTLVARAEDPATPGDAAAFFLLLVEAIGSPSPEMESRLLALRDAKPELADTVDDALVAMEGEAGGLVLARRITESPDTWPIRRAAEARARAAVPAIARSLSHEDPAVRRSAAQALGYIGDAGGVDALVLALQDESDIVFTGLVVTSLGRIGSPLAREPLAAMARSHAFPGIRALATRAMGMIDQPGPVAAYPTGYLGVELETWDVAQQAMGACTRVPPAAPLPPRRAYLSEERDARRLDALAFDTYILSYGAGDEDEQKAKDPDGVIVVHRGNMREYRTPRRQTPNAALRVDNGWIVTAFRGEWGGEIAFIPDEGEPQVLASEFALDVLRLGDRIVVVAGLAHLGLDEGRLLEVRGDPDGRWQVMPWRELPGMPDRHHLTRTGELWLEFDEGTALRVSPEGRLLPGCDR